VLGAKLQGFGAAEAAGALAAGDVASVTRMRLVDYVVGQSTSRQQDVRECVDVWCQNSDSSRLMPYQRVERGHESRCAIRVTVAVSLDGPQHDRAEAELESVSRSDSH